MNKHSSKSAKSISAGAIKEKIGGTPKRKNVDHVNGKLIQAAVKLWDLKHKSASQPERKKGGMSFGRGNKGSSPELG